MAEFIDWFKALSTFAKDNKWMILWVAGALAGWTGTGFQTMNVSAKEQQRVKDVRDVATAMQKQIVSMEPKVIVKKSNCNECIKRIEKLERWH